MATPSSGERVRAARVRTKQKEGRASPDDIAWLAGYESRTLHATLKRAKAEQLALPMVEAHATVPATDRIDPASLGWVPTMPDAPKEKDAAPENGVPKPPPTGTPLVETQVAAKPGDPAAADQFAALIVFIMQFGLAAARELAADTDTVPDQMRAIVNSDELAAQAMGTVHEAAKRVALKYGFQQIPLADEALVAGAVVGSGALVWQQHKRRKAKPANANEAATTPPTEPQRKATPDEAAAADFGSKMWNGNN
jgi:hypothetical protein